jgi:hypothetical protein
MYDADRMAVGNETEGIQKENIVAYFRVFVENERI